MRRVCFDTAGPRPLIGHDTAYLDKHKLGENIAYKGGWKEPVPRSVHFQSLSLLPLDWR